MGLQFIHRGVSPGLEKMNDVDPRFRETPLYEGEHPPRNQLWLINIGSTLLHTDTLNQSFGTQFLHIAYSLDCVGRRRVP